MTKPLKRPTGAISPTGNKAPVFRSASGQVQVATKGKPAQFQDAPKLVDICVVFDTTGSMRNKIDGLKDSMIEFIDELARLKLDWRFTVVPFGDLTVPGDRIVGDLPFCKDAQTAQRMIRSMPGFHGGGNDGESSLVAMAAAMAKPYRKGAVKVVIMLTDERPLFEKQLTPEIITSQLTRQEFVCFVASMPQQGYEPWAEQNAGKWYPISSSLSTAGILDFLRGILKDVAKVSSQVHEMGGGSVKKYLAAVERNKQIGR
jgi:hypothetical protein